MYKLLKAKLENSTNATQIAAAEIISLFKPISAKRNEVLLSLEETCKYYFFIEKGSLRLFTTNTEGKESSRYFAFEGSFCTALPSFIDQKPAMEFLQAIEDDVRNNTSSADDLVMKLARYEVEQMMNDDSS